MRERVAARHWVMLGVIAQMPDMRIHIKLLSKLMYDHVSNVKPEKTVEVLSGRDLVSYDKESGWVTLTELGATRQRQHGRPEVIRFVRVPGVYIRQQLTLTK